MKYFFILGSNPTLSIAELVAVFHLSANDARATVLADNKVLMIEQEQPIDARSLMNNLGGTIKIGLIRAESTKNTQDILASIKELTPLPEKKFYFGFSSYIKGLNIKPIAMEFKKYFKENNLSCRWVVSNEPVLSSVVVEQNGLVDGGSEYVFFEQANKVLIGQTLAVQPFKDLSFRDYGRPARDDYSGMLPPKLAQIMINLAAPTKTAAILDPFCGSGTVLTEALLMDYKQVIGSDVSAKAVSDTEKNITWIKEQFKIKDGKAEVSLGSATELTKFIKPDTVGAIVTEPYLGPQRGQHDIREVVKELEELYTQCILEFKKVLRSDGRVVMIWPVFRDKVAGNIMLKKNIIGDFKIVNPLPKGLMNSEVKLSNRLTLIYGRADQRVWREIVILEK